MSTNCWRSCARCWARRSGDLGRFRRFLLLRVFKYLPVWVLLVLGEVPLVLQTVRSEFRGLLESGPVRRWQPGRGHDSALPRRGKPDRSAGAAIADALAKARRLHDTCRWSEPRRITSRNWSASRASSKAPPERWISS